MSKGPVRAVIALMIANMLLAPFSVFAQQPTSIGLTLLERPVSVTVEPVSAHIATGSTHDFRAYAHFVANPSIEVTDSEYTVWTSSNEPIATVNNTTSKGTVTGVAQGSATISATYGPSGYEETGEATVNVGIIQTVTSISVTPDPFTVYTDASLHTRQLTATAHYSCDPLPCTPNPDFDVTFDAATVWSSSDPAIISVNATGMTTGLVQGTANITAQYMGLSDMAVGSSHVHPGGGGGGATTPTPVVTQETVQQTQETQETQQTTQQTQETQAVPEETQETQALPEETQETQALPEETQEVQPTQEEPVQTQIIEETPPVDELPPPPELPGPPPPGEEEFAVPPVIIDSTTGEPVTTGTGSQPESTQETALGEQGEAATQETAYIGPVLVDPETLPDELKVTRGEIIAMVINQYNIEQAKYDLLSACYANLDGCLSIFKSVSTYDGINLQAAPFTIGNMQLYPDVPPDMINAYEINLATMIGAVQGYYEDPGSPFKPNQVISRIEAIKVLLGTVDIQRWFYYDELEAMLGGIEAVKAQTTPFGDIMPTRDAMWWYPVYLNQACEIGMINCTEGTNFRPDDWITDEELLDMQVRLSEYLANTKFSLDTIGDPDGDLLKTYMEQTVYFTNPENRDTDSDKLYDNEEVLEFRTSAFLVDTDADTLDDYTEVKVLFTDPLKFDTDGDAFSDNAEVAAGSDPLDPDSIPEGSQDKAVSPEWAEKYNLDVTDGMQDSDGDGLSDMLEYQYSTNPISTDSDADGFSDTEEVLQLGTDPNVKNDAETPATIGVRITNFVEYQPVGDNTPMIKGIAPVGSIVRIVLKNDFGHEKILGDTSVDENYMFIFQVVDPIRDGSYMLVAKALDPQAKKITVSNPVHVIIDSTRNVAAPVPSKLGGEDISEEVLLKNLRIEIHDKQPVLIGQTEYGNRVEATWRSIVTTSALIADTATGEFMIKAPTELSLGQHEVYVTATRSKDMAQSPNIRILFNVGLALSGESALLKPAAEVKPLELGVVFGGVQEFAQTNPFLFWIIVAMVLLIAGAVTYLAMISRKK